MGLPKIYRDALAERREIVLPPIRWAVAATAAAVALYAATAVAIAPQNRDWHFISERGAVTALSAVLLSTAAGIAFVALFLAWTHRLKAPWFWALVGGGLGFFALDELLEFHEKAGTWLDGSVGQSGGFRHWDDVVVVLFGVVGLAMGLLFLPQVLRYARFAEMLAVAFGFFCLHTAIDTFATPPSTVTVIAEETAKLFSAAFLALSTFVGLLGVVALARPPAEERPPTVTPRPRSARGGPGR